MVFQTHLETLPTLEVSRELDVRSKQDKLKVIRGPAGGSLLFYAEARKAKSYCCS
jgi:hypothetical protein